MKRIILVISITSVAVVGSILLYLWRGQSLTVQPQPSLDDRQPSAAIGPYETSEPGADVHEEEGEPSGVFSHGHGMAVNLHDSSKLYIGTHYGAYVMQNDKTLSKIGNSEDDLMGFAAHPSLPNVLFASGHPKAGGNLGVLRSDNAGVTWKKIADGVGGPVDFHAIAVSPVNTALMYGWYDGLQRSEDGGTSWKKIPTNLEPVYRLVAHPKDEGTLFAANGMGLWVSHNRGETWGIISDIFNQSATLAFGINPKNPDEMLSYGPKLKLAKSADAGVTWKTISQDLGEDVVYLFAYDPNNGSVVYALTKNNRLFKSINGGQDWKEIRL